MKRIVSFFSLVVVFAALAIAQAPQPTGTSCPMSKGAAACKDCCGKKCCDGSAKACSKDCGKDCCQKADAMKCCAGSKMCAKGCCQGASAMKCCKGAASTNAGQ